MSIYNRIASNLVVAGFIAVVDSVTTDLPSGKKEAVRTVGTILLSVLGLVCLKKVQVQAADKACEALKQATEK